MPRTQKDKLEEVLSLLKYLKEEKEKSQGITEEELIFLRQKIKEQKINEETRLIVLRRLMSGSAWALLAAVVYAVVYSLKHWFFTNNSI